MTAHSRERPTIEILLLSMMAGSLSMSTHQYNRFFFSGGIQDSIVKQSNLYALLCDTHCTNPNTSKQKRKIYLALSCTWPCFYYILDSEQNTFWLLPYELSLFYVHTEENLWLHWSGIITQITFIFLIALWHIKPLSWLLFSIYG